MCGKCERDFRSLLRLRSGTSVAFEQELIKRPMARSFIRGDVKLWKCSVHSVTCRKKNKPFCTPGVCRRYFPVLIANKWTFACTFMRSFYWIEGEILLFEQILVNGTNEYWSGKINNKLLLLIFQLVIYESLSRKFVTWWRGCPKTVMMCVEGIEERLFQTGSGSAMS